MGRPELEPRHVVQRHPDPEYLRYHADGAWSLGACVVTRLDRCSKSDSRGSMCMSGAKPSGFAETLCL